MRQREKLLAIAVGGLLVLILLGYSYGAVSDMFGSRHDRLRRLTEEVTSKEGKLNRGTAAARRIKAWQDQSLPADAEFARTEYQNWLVGLADKVHLSGAEVETSRVIARLGIYKLLPFSVRGRGDLGQLTQFMYEFYKVDQLHQIMRLSVKPLEGADQGKLDITFTIEAMILPGSENQELVTRESKRLKLKTLDDYRKPIVERNVFAPFKPKVEVAQGAAPSADPVFDSSKHAYVTAIVTQGSQPQVWLHVRTSGELLKLREGDKFDLGPLHGTIKRIGVREIEIETGGKRRLVSVGDSISQGRDL